MPPRGSHPGEGASASSQGDAFRVLVIDDNERVRSDFRKILVEHRPDESELDRLAARVFSRQRRELTGGTYQLDLAQSGEHGVLLVQQALAREEPFALAFVDMRMPGIDGVETCTRIWARDKNIHVVICTAYSDFSWREVMARVGDQTSNLHLLRKPFDAAQVRKITQVLTTRWRRETSPPQGNVASG